MTNPRSRKRYASTIYQFQHPDWTPLLELVGPDLVGWFTWMCELRLSDGASVHAYRHQETRRSLHLATDGRAYEYLAPAALDDRDPRRYREWSRVDALDEAFLDWSRFHEGDPRFAAQRTLLAEVREVAEAGGTMPVDPEHVRRQLRLDAAAAAARLHEQQPDPGRGAARFGAEGNTSARDRVGADAFLSGRDAA